MLQEPSGWRYGCECLSVTGFVYSYNFEIISDWESLCRLCIIINNFAFQRYALDPFWKVRYKYSTEEKVFVESGTPRRKEASVAVAFGPVLKLLPTPPQAFQKKLAYKPRIKCRKSILGWLLLCSPCWGERGLEHWCRKLLQWELRTKRQVWGGAGIPLV